MKKKILNPTSRNICYSIPVRKHEPKGKLMKIYHNNHYEAWVSEDKKSVADAGFYSVSTLDEVSELEVGNSDLFLCIGLDMDKQPNRNNGSYDFAEEYARKVAQMVYEMMLKQ